ncbi:hypothetical protein CERSUDRAFT_108803 [Gelatoporia subvermispora B]|uniref:Uncharacterized protein n=1 Tax=Ceriporiopsis subvermispora (strain B) TaxID=914234 RepID=M2QJR5_CERS8|nr:hypothetical protein CERSUDRAFT_108803 [Gelatoporia subvermispora B]
MPLLSRAQPLGSSSLARSSSPVPAAATPHQSMPTIRLISATPAGSGLASDASTSFSSVAPFASSPLSPKADSEGPRKRIVPKKSKLGLLVGTKTKEKASKDFSDVVRRVGGGSSSIGRGGVEIYVDHSEDPEMGDLVVVKKKKSRLGLDGMKWGTLGEVTNIPATAKDAKQASTDNLLKVKGDDSQRWWSIGRGRKDSKENKEHKENKENHDKPQVRSKTPEPLKPTDGRARFNSLDSGILLTTPTSRQPLNREDFGAQSLLAVPADPANGLLAPNAQPTGSIAVRAMRSVRSIARMASWAQLGGDKEQAEAAPAPTISRPKLKEKTKTKQKEKESGDTKKKKKKQKSEKTEKSKEKEAREKTIRSSGSSFEAGALSPQASPAPPAPVETARTLGRKKQSTLGLGLPSTLRIAAARNSTALSGASQAPSAGRLSAESAHLMGSATHRPSSIMSTGSSLRPPSTASGVSAFETRSARSSSSSVVSIKWDEDRIRTSKELQRKERSRRSRDDKTTKESRRSSEARRRTPISEIFPEVQTQRSASGSSQSPPASVFDKPIVTVEEATADGHSDPSKSPAETPAKRARPRPVSEQLLGRTRPQAMCEESFGVLSILDAATNDLASLINRLDLEATPASSANSSPIKPTPLQGSGQESPLKRRAGTLTSPLKMELRDSTASISSLRPYAKAQSTTTETLRKPSDAVRIVGQQIAPWSELNWHVSPKKEATKTTVAFRPTHKRTLTPAPDIEPPPVFQPLRPAKPRVVSQVHSSPASSVATPTAPVEKAAPSSRTFGSRTSSKKGSHSSKGSRGSEEGTPCPTPMVERTGGIFRSGSGLALKDTGRISPQARKGLALSGTLGGSTEPDVDLDDPDSDIPDELQVILAGQSDEDTMSFRPGIPSPRAPPEIPLPVLEIEQVADEVASLPVFQAQLYDEEANLADLDDGTHGASSEDDTNKSFDFTGEIQKLNESGASDRLSFVEQVESAFRTPARIELDLGFGDKMGFKGDLLAVPPVPALPLHLRQPPAEDVAPRSISGLEDDSTPPDGSVHSVDIDTGLSFNVDFTMDLSGCAIEDADDDCRVYTKAAISPRSVKSKASDGRLNVDFRFGGKPAHMGMSLEPPAEIHEKPLTLSDIIPPLSHNRSLSDSSLLESDSVLKSIMAKASEFPPFQRQRLDSDSSSKRRARDFTFNDTSATSHSRSVSEASFTGFDSFEEVRRGFEFGRDRPAFYPPPAALPRVSHQRDESVFSIASISSYGALIDSGTFDPFGYAPTQPPSDDMSMSYSVDDTFSFIHKGRQRHRVDSDASSFYFKAPLGQAAQQRRGHRRHESALSIASNAPPVSLYNRSFAGHRRNDSNTSGSSVAHSYALHGAYGGRAAWARHRQDASIDSVASEFSARRLGRPGIGDKMFDSDYGMPLAAISASPNESYCEEPQNDRTDWDSIIDDERRYSAEDSLFSKTGHRTSISSESVFGWDGAYPPADNRLPMNHFRPLSMMSDFSTHSPRKEDDTMISMLGGGHVRRRSIGSMIEASPCVRREKRHTSVRASPVVMQVTAEEPPVQDSPKDARLIEKPSIASTSSYQFGDERMIMARKGLLERQSLENSALMAHGEDLLASLRSQPMFTRPEPASRSRSSTVTSSSGAETPPLSSSDGSSISGGSQSSIDVGHLQAMLTNATHPIGGIARARARARGTGHRRRISQARASRTSVYETIQEEASILLTSPSPAQTATAASDVDSSLSVQHDSVLVVDADIDSGLSDWDDEHGIVTLRKYYALRDEADETVQESKRAWQDTSFSIYAVQSFDPPRTRAGMRALLEHSQKTYNASNEIGPRRLRSRTSSRATPYPLPQAVPISPELVHQSFVSSKSADSAEKPKPKPSLALRERSLNASADVTTLSPPTLEALKPFTPFSVPIAEPSPKGVVPPLPTRRRVTSSARRTALGWTKRNPGKPTSQSQKENAPHGMVITPSETLRLNRPRPRGRPTPARVPVPAA